ncbi:MAG: N-glycanase [Flavobacteriaceae bacterium]|nr:N-glycanase [Flavobacteriaceae bacterium]
MTARLLLLILSIVSCQQTPQSIGNTSIEVFKDTHLYFDQALKQDTTIFNQELIRLDAGRVLLKKIKLPKYTMQPKVTINMTLESNGDAWDKSGSLFVIPKTSELTILDFEKDSTLTKNINTSSPLGVNAFTYRDLKYIPNVELLRFMTPFGVGFFNNHEHIKERKPIYIPQWEDDVKWTQDITQLLPLLENEVYIGIYIDTWTKEGYKFSVNIDFEESKIKNHNIKKQDVIPLVNTTKYVANQSYYDTFHNIDLSTDFTLDKAIKNAKLYYITTGHGGHENGDEFTKKQHIVFFDHKVIKQFVPWRDDCAAFRRFNPHSGVWTESTIWKGKEIQERIASSDYSRSNWCPGSDVSPEIITLGNLEKGTHNLNISVPEAQAINGNKINYWMTSAYIVYDK